MAISVISDVESEKVLINQMIIDDSIIDGVITKAPIESFYNQNYKKCYQVILDIAGRKEKVDLTSFWIECTTKKVVPTNVLEEVTNAIASTVNWEFYATNVTKCYQARQLRKLLSEKNEQVDTENTEELITEISKEIENISNLSSDVVIKTQKEIMTELAYDINSMLKDPKSMMGYMTGLKAFDSITSGINKEYIIICARPSMGKTFLAQQIALNVAKEHKVDFIELEMSAKQINFRNIAMLSNLKMNDIRYSRGIDSMKVSRIQNAMEYLATELNKNYRVIEPVSRKLSSIISHIRRAVKRDGVEMVIIDHVGLIQSDNRYASAWEAPREISNGLQKLQRELGIPIIILSQRSRSSEGGNNKGDLSTIRGSGAFEEDADLIITIEHARVTDEAQQAKGDSENIETELYISKNRNGNCGVGKCIFRPAFGKFVDVLETDNYR